MSYIFFSGLRRDVCSKMHSRKHTAMHTRTYSRTTLARPRQGLLPLLAEKSVSLPRPGRRSVDTTATTLARRPRSTLSHPGIFVAHSRLRPCCRNAPREPPSSRRIRLPLQETGLSNGVDFTGLSKRKRVGDYWIRYSLHRSSRPNIS